MTFNTNLKNIFLVVFTTLILSACSTAKKSGDMDGDVYTGKETVKYLDIFQNHPYIFNLGHGVLPETDPNMFEYMVNTVKNY